MDPIVSLPLAVADLVKTMERTGESFGIDWAHFGAQAVSFLIVAFLLRRFAYERILNVLDERRKRIAQSLADADRIKAEVAATEARRRDVLAEAGQQAAALLDDARRAAAKVYDEETHKASAAAEQILAKARETAVIETTRLRTELKREMGHLVVLTAARVTGKVLTPEDQERLASETNRSLAA